MKLTFFSIQALVSILALENCLRWKTKLKQDANWGIFKAMKTKLTNMVRNRKEREERTNRNAKFKIDEDR